jgi:hypothetical protein
VSPAPSWGAFLVRFLISRSRIKPPTPVDRIFGDGLIRGGRHADQVLADEELLAAVHAALAQRRPKSRSHGRLRPLRGLAEALNDQGVRTRRGAIWSASVVKRDAIKLPMGRVR